MLIKKKLILAIAVIFILLSSLTVIGRFSTHLLTKTTNFAYVLGKETTYLQMLLRGVNEIFITEGSRASIELAKKAIQKFEEIHNSLLSKTEDHEFQKVLINKIEPMWQTIREEIKPFLVAQLNVESNEIMVKYGKLISQTDALLEEVETLSQKASSIADFTVTRTRTINNIVIGSILVVMCLLFFYLYKSIANPINSIRNLMIAVAEGEGNLTRHIDIKSRDEIGETALVFNKILDKFRIVIEKVARSLNAVSNTSEKLQIASERIHSNMADQG